LEEKLNGLPCRFDHILSLEGRVCVIAGSKQAGRQTDKQGEEGRKGEEGEERKGKRRKSRQGRGGEGKGREG